MLKCHISLKTDKTTYQMLEPRFSTSCGLMSIWNSVWKSWTPYPLGEREEQSFKRQHLRWYGGALMYMAWWVTRTFVKASLILNNIQYIQVLEQHTSISGSCLFQQDSVKPHSAQIHSMALSSKSPSAKLICLQFRHVTYCKMFATLWNKIWQRRHWTV